MKAIVIKSYGSNDVVEVMNLDIPEPRSDEVLIHVQTAGVNPIDWKIRNGAGERLGLKLPIRLGGEIAGIVEKVGDGVQDFTIGDAVYGMVKTGGFSEYVIAKASDIWIKPNNVGFHQAAAIPLGGLTAWQAIFDLAELKAGQRILITGASGAVGSLAVQFAKNKGASVVGTASSKNAEYVQSLGVDEFIDYTKENFEDIVGKFDVVFDTVGGDTFEKAHRTLKRGGFLVTSVAFPNEATAQEFGVKVARVFCKPDQRELVAITEMVEAGELQARVSMTLPLDEIRRALEISEKGKANGKIVMTINSPSYCVAGITHEEIEK